MYVYKCKKNKNICQWYFTQTWVSKFEKKNSIYDHLLFIKVYIYGHCAVIFLIIIGFVLLKIPKFVNVRQISLQ